MDQTIFKEITQILERDSKNTTYKFALLRGTIDIIQSKSPFIQLMHDRARMPIGLMVEKWLLYYYPILNADVFIPQKSGEKPTPGNRLAFRRYFKPVTDFYQNQGGYSAFYNDLVIKGIPKAIRKEFIVLVKVLAKTIVNMPMKYIGRSISPETHSIYSLYERKFKRPSPNETIDIQWLIHAFGTFTIPRLYYEAFEFLGSFIAGMDGILYQWAQFTVRASGEKLGMEDALRFLLSTPTTERDVLEAKNHYDRILASEGKLKCVWTGRPIRDLNIDHVIPFTVWKNNQLWNLLPTSAEVNRQKSDRIPSSQILLERKDPILNYWELMAGSIPERFFKEIHYSLLGEGTVNNWQERAFHKLSENCQYLIDVRGFEPWPS